jgi:hypothetical protein
MTDGKLRPKQDRAIRALLSERTVQAAATAAGVGLTTLHRWIKDPAFDAAYRDARHAFHSQSMARLHQMVPAAITTIGKAMLDQSTPPATRVRAAHSVLDHAADAIEMENLGARLDELERSVAILKKPNH